MPKWAPGLLCASVQDVQAQGRPSDTLHPPHLLGRVSWQRRLPGLRHQQGFNTLKTLMPPHLPGRGRRRRRLPGVQHERRRAGRAGRRLHRRVGTLRTLVPALLALRRWRSTRREARRVPAHPTSSVKTGLRAGLPCINWHSGGWCGA